MRVAEAPVRLLSPPRAPYPRKTRLRLPGVGSLAGIVVGVALDIRKRGLKPDTAKAAASLAPEEKKTWA